MDTSKEYIEMCEKAQEIQYDRKHAFVSGDFYDSGEVYIQPINTHDENPFGTEKGEHIWLPRQDQLQEMIVKGFTDSVNYLMTMLHRFYCGMDKYKFKSMEQLLLIYVMYNKYNKQWNPETKEWEKV